MAGTPYADTHIAQLKHELKEAAHYYSADYFEARSRLLTAASQSGLEHHALTIHAPSPRPEPLTIDVTIAGPARPQSALVLSSGVHGVEGLFGSAVQLAFLEKWNRRPVPGAAVVWIHAVNPFGFAWLRRFNEDNVDLNRNFLLPEERYTGSPPLAGKFRRVLGLDRPRPRYGLWSARMALLAVQHGMRSFWETLPVGQYDFPDWLFFGGTAPAQSVSALQDFLPTVLSEAKEIAHLDFHTGLGPWAHGQLLVSDAEGLDNAEWWTAHFGTKQVTRMRSTTGSYDVRGGFGPWLRALFPACRYHYATAEFGTYSAMQVIRALADELRCHIELGTDSHGHPSRRRLLDTFVPRSRGWRAKTLHTSLAWIDRSIDALWGPRS